MNPVQLSQSPRLASPHLARVQNGGGIESSNSTPTVVTTLRSFFLAFVQNARTHERTNEPNEINQNLKAIDDQL